MEKGIVVNITINVYTLTKQFPSQQPLLDKRISRIAQMLIFPGCHFELHGVENKKILHQRRTYDR